MKIARDCFGDRFIGEFGRIVTITRRGARAPIRALLSTLFFVFHQRLDGSAERRPETGSPCLPRGAMRHLQM